MLPTQLDTFTTQFFGNQLGKAVSGDSIIWQLPCGLDVGAAANPRLPGESLACYFLRLFEAGITGTIGPQGEQGLPGKCGQDAFTITLQNFNQPTLQSPYVAVTTRPGFSLVPGLPVEVQGSGYYIVQDAESDGATLLQLTQPFVGAPAVIPAGAIVVSSGLPGAIIKGPQGPQGPPGIQGVQGAQGPAAASATTGPQGPTVHLQHATKGYGAFAGNPPIPATSQQPLTTVYQNLGTNPGNTPIFTTPDASNSFYYAVFTGFLGFVNLNSGTNTGTLSMKVVGPSGDVSGGERVRTIAVATSSFGYYFMVPLVLQNTTGAIASWRLQAKASAGLVGFNLASFAGLGVCGVNWFKF